MLTDVWFGSIVVLIGWMSLFLMRSLSGRTRALLGVLLPLKVFVMATVGEALYSQFIGGTYDGFVFHTLAVEMVNSSTGFIEFFSEVDFIVGQSGSNNFAGLVAYIYYFSAPSITIAHMAMAALSVLSLVLGYRAFSIAFPNVDARFFVIPLVLFPSSFVFSSLVLKDAPTLLFGATFLYGLATFSKVNRGRGLLLMLIAIYAMMLIRVYLGFMLIAALGIGLLPFVLSIRLGFFTPIVRAAGISFLLIGSLILATFVRDVFITPLADSTDLSAEQRSPLEIVAWWKETVARQKLADVGHSGLHGSGTPITSVRDIVYIPGEMVSVFFRPFLFEVYNVTSFIASVENTFLLAIVLKILFSFRRLWHYYKSDPIFLTSLAFVLMFTISFTLVLGNIGTAFRVKVATYPFLMLVFALAMSIRPSFVSPPTVVSRLRYLGRSTRSS